MIHVVFNWRLALSTILILPVISFFHSGCSSVDEAQTPDGGSDGDTDTDTDTDGDPTHRSGSLVQGIHHTEVAYSATGSAGVLWLPLPLDYATQVPIYYEPTVDPEEAIDHLVYEVDDVGNAGVYFHFVEEGPFNPVSIHWDAVVLTRDITDEERPDYYAADLDVDTWIQPTQVVASDYQPIAELGEQIAQESTDPFDQMLDIIEWTSTNITYPSSTEEWLDVPGLDATSAYDSGKGSCTAYANLAAAIGRAGDLPSRVLANIMVGVTQQTHYIDEFYLGEELGWRRVEPQTTLSTLDESYALAIRKVHPDDEGALSFTMTGFSMLGVPWKTLVTPVENPNRFTSIMNTDYFEDCPHCDNRADLLAEIDGSKSRFDQAFDLAQSLWQEDLQSLLADGYVEEDIQVIRRRALTAKSLDDVIDLLEDLNQL